MELLANKNCLVTGGSRGIGAATALALARQGANVAVHFRSSAHEANQVVAQCRSLGVRARAIQADLADPGVGERIRELLKPDFDGLDVLVQNAGVGNTSIGRPIVAETGEENFNRVFRPNVMGPLAITRALLPGMRNRPGDRSVVFLSSIATTRFGAGGGAYAASKAALEALALTMAGEERPYGIRVNIVAPGLIDTDMGRAVAATRGEGTSLKDLAFAKPLSNRVATAEDVANAIVFLCSTQASYITHARLPVDGGLGR